MGSGRLTSCVLTAADHDRGGVTQQLRSMVASHSGGDLLGQADPVGFQGVVGFVLEAQPTVYTPGSVNHLAPGNTSLSTWFLLVFTAP